jgi:predicted RNase H-like nuclease (RuvC/YqgF family)
LANGDVNWQLATMQDKFLGLKDSSKSAIVAIEQLYQLLPSKIGWINIDKFPRESTKLTTITLTSEYPAIDDIICFYILIDSNPFYDITAMENRVIFQKENTLI